MLFSEVEIVKISYGLDPFYLDCLIWLVIFHKSATNETREEAEGS